MRPQHDRREERLERLARLERRRLRLEPCLDVREPRVEQGGSIGFGRPVGPAIGQRVADLGERPRDARDVPRAAVLRDELPPGPERAGEAPEERWMVGHPVERRRRQDRVRRSVERERLAQVGVHVGDPRAEAGEPSSCLLEHPRRSVERHDSNLRQPFEQLLRHPAAPAARVEHRPDALRIETPDDVGAPAGLRRRNAVVRRGVPVVAHDDVAAHRIEAKPPEPGEGDPSATVTRSVNRATRSRPSPARSPRRADGARRAR